MPVYGPAAQGSGGAAIPVFNVADYVYWPRPHDPGYGAYSNYVGPGQHGPIVETSPAGSAPPESWLWGFVLMSDYSHNSLSFDMEIFLGPAGGETIVTSIPCAPNYSYTPWQTWFPVPIDVAGRRVSYRIRTYNHAANGVYVRTLHSQHGGNRLTKRSIT